MRIYYGTLTDRTCFFFDPQMLVLLELSGQRPGMHGRIRSLDASRAMIRVGLRRRTHFIGAGTQTVRNANEIWDPFAHH